MLKDLVSNQLSFKIIIALYINKRSKLVWLGCLRIGGVEVGLENE